MKKILLFCLLLVGIMFGSCEKDPGYLNNTPSVEVLDYSNLLRTSVTLNGELTSQSEALVTNFGFKIGTDADVTSSLVQYIALDSTDNGLFSAAISDLEIGATYFYVAYATNGKDSVTTDIQSFTTATESAAYLSAPTITYEYEIVATSSVEDTGGSDIVTAGFCWSSSSSSPSVLDASVQSDSIGTTFSAVLGSLAENETYYIRAFADNAAISGSQTLSYSEAIEYTVPVNIIPIADDEFKSYLISNFDSDDSGDISRQEASLVTDITITGSSVASLSGIEYFTNLESLTVSGTESSKGKLTTVDLSSNVNLTYLDLSYNALTALDLSANTLLTYLNCSGNALTALDLTNNTALEELYCTDNKLSALDIILNSSLTKFDASQNSDLYVIYVWEGFDYTDTNFVKDDTTTFVVEGTVYIPDANFKAYLVTNFDTDGDGDISDEEAEQIRSINVYTDDITTVIGIENFANLTNLSICGSGHDNGTTEYMYGALTSLDISKNIALTDLNCISNQLTSLDVSNNVELKNLWCGDNPLTSLDVSSNPALFQLACSANELTTLDLSNNSALITLYCDSNELTTLDISNNSALITFDCSSNQLATLDLSNNTALEILYCSSNQLTSLNISNNTLLTTFNAKGNSDLYYIFVWDGFIESNYSEFYKDDQVSYISVIPFEDANFKDYVVANYDTNSDGEISIGEANLITSIDVNTDNITSVSGIEHFTNLADLKVIGTDVTWHSDLLIYEGSGQLTSLNLSGNTALTNLYCYCNNITSLDLSNNTSLTYLDCMYNHLTVLDLSKNTSLMHLNCLSNQLTSLSVPTSTSLEYLSCHNNKLASIDVSGYPSLTNLDCSDNQLTSLDVTSNTELTSLSCAGNYYISTLDVSKNTELTYLLCNDNKLNVLDLSNNKELVYLSCGNNELISIDVSNSINLTNLYCRFNQLPVLDITKNTLLTELNCFGNQLTLLDVANNTALTYLNCYNNQLTSLDVSNNTLLTELNCSYNQITSLDVSNNIALTDLSCYSNQLTSLDIANNTSLIELECYSNSDLYEIYVWDGFDESTFDSLSKDDQASFVVK